MTSKEFVSVIKGCFYKENELLEKPLKQLDDDLTAVELIKEKGVNILLFIQYQKLGSFNYEDYKYHLSKDNFSLTSLTAKEFDFIMKWLNNDK